MSNPNSSRYTDEDRETRKLHSRADAFRYSAPMERLAELKRDRPDEYDRMSPIARISLGHYQAAKDAARQLGRNVSAPTDQEV
ncbi:hypothetical protein [Kitasatospora sp. NRRL B-11411]|uniref:hypothetical protein n=1 Tax=Kitasatospora sp. NRRL B-11411 TaxID=1463822 RepID=UPI0004C2DC8A|nr:hypothetical protein [Kitasatospora sp. NRRL B-11411]